MIVLPSLKINSSKDNGQSTVKLCTYADFTLTAEMLKGIYIGLQGPSLLSVILHNLFYDPFVVKTAVYPFTASVSSIRTY